MSYGSRETPRPTLNAARARQAGWGRQVFWVLVFGTLLAALGMFAAWTWKADNHVGAPGPAQETISGRGADAPPPPRVARQAP